jgi:DNA-binding NtrC family response regulator
MSTYNPRAEQSATILFVDPSFSICEVVSLILTEAGHTVFTATCAAEALQIATREEAEIRLVLSLEYLPEEEWAFLSDELRTLHPEATFLMVREPRLFASRPEKAVWESVTEALSEEVNSREMTLAGCS